MIFFLVFIYNTYICIKTILIIKKHYDKIDKLDTLANILPMYVLEGLCIWQIIMLNFNLYLALVILALHIYYFWDSK